VFAALDEDQSERLEFEEFVRGFFLLSPMASREEKVVFSYKVCFFLGFIPCLFMSIDLRCGW
jgi:hypothetical protein